MHECTPNLTLLNVFIGICFWTPKELAEQQEWREKANPFTIQEMLDTVSAEKQAKQEEIMKKEQDIAKNLGKLDQWMKDIEIRRSKKEEEAKVAKARKDRLIEEVRRHFGFELDPRDERFKEMLAAKEKEQRKAMKESKKKEKEARIIAKIVESNDDKKTKKAENPEDWVESCNNRVAISRVDKL